jgi:hypothetical protein
MSHVILLGDSIFDNGIYVPGEPSVVEQVNAALPSDSKATLLARDGDVTSSVEEQLNGLPADATHLFVSVGGNDALGYSHILTNGPALLDELTRTFFEFEGRYREMIGKVLSHGLPTAVSTIYTAIPDLERHEVMALSLFNDTILRVASNHGLPLVDLRLICTEPTDYSRRSPIEPSSIGGAKIAAAITRVIQQHPFSEKSTTIYA